MGKGDKMSIWTHFTGSFGLEGVILDNMWDTVSDTIRSIITPMPGYPDYPAGYSIRLQKKGNIHFTDVLVSGDLRHIDTLLPIEEWLKMIARRVDNAKWDIRCGCFYAFVECQKPVIYYYDSFDPDNSLVLGWRKIENVNGVLLQEEKNYDQD
jgi:hypothetical protein